MSNIIPDGTHPAQLHILHDAGGCSNLLRLVGEGVVQTLDLSYNPHLVDSQTPVCIHFLSQDAQKGRRIDRNAGLMPVLGETHTSE